MLIKKATAEEQEIDTSAHTYSYTHTYTSNDAPVWHELASALRQTLQTSAEDMEERKERERGGEKERRKGDPTVHIIRAHCQSSI